MFRDKKKQILLCKAYLIITVIVVVAYVFDKTGMDHEFVLRLTGVTILFFTIPEIVQQSSLTFSEKLFINVPVVIFSGGIWLHTNGKIWSYIVLTIAVITAARIGKK